LHEAAAVTFLHVGLAIEGLHRGQSGRDRAHEQDVLAAVACNPERRLPGAGRLLATADEDEGCRKSD
jgi:hypothetical protein